MDNPKGNCFFTDLLLLPNVVQQFTRPLIFLIDKANSEHQVIVYKNIYDLILRLEWQEIFEGKSIIIDEKGMEYQ